MERKCASESETKRNRLSELLTRTAPLPDPAIVSSRRKTITGDCMRRHHLANVNWITFGKISVETAYT
jgi:hypothetical protein